MNRLPLFKYNSRARSTSWGIALCTMFLVASFSVASGLKLSMDKLEGNFSSEYFLVTKPDSNGPSFFEADQLESVLEKTATGLFSEELLEPSGIETTVFSISDSHHILKESIVASGNTVLIGTSLHLSGNITIGSDSHNASIGGGFSSTIFPSDWVLASDSLMRELTEQTAAVNFAILKDPTTLEMDSLTSAGFVLQNMIGIIDFLSDGVDQIGQDVWWVLVPSSFVVALLAYSFLGSETVDKRHEIGILKTIGAGRAKILSYLMANSIIISLWGGLLGLALGIVLSYGLSTALSSAFTSAFMLEIDEWLLVASLTATVAAGILGALPPAIRMTTTSPVQDLKEASI